MEKTITAIVPVKGNSSRLPGKNQVKRMRGRKSK